MRVLLVTKLPINWKNWNSNHLKDLNQLVACGVAKKAVKDWTKRL
jgi:hypothetical protein